MNSFLLINDILKTTIDGVEDKYERILWISSDYKTCYTIKLFIDKTETSLNSIEDIENNIKEGNMVILEEDPTAQAIDYKCLHENKRLHIDNAYEIVKKFISTFGEPDCYIESNKGKRSTIIQISKEFGVYFTTTYRYIRKYWQGGQTKSALIPNYKNCGRGREDDKADGYNKLGRPSYLSFIQDEEMGVNIDKEIKIIFKKAINRYYYNHKRKGLKKVYEQMIYELFSSVVIEDGERKRYVLPSNELPTLNQFKYWFYKTRNLDKEIQKRYGESTYMKDYRAIKSDSIYEAFGPGHRYQVDATVADVWLVNRIDRSIPIGRPVVYFAIDVFSRLITGVHVSLEGPSWNGMSSLLYNCFEDKVKFCQEFGIDIDESSWPARGFPSIVIGDRGELVGPIAEPIIEELGIELENTPTYRGDAKGIVEQNFRVINTKILKWVPGEVIKDYQTRVDKDYRLDAKLDIYQFTQIIIQAVLNRNKSMINEYPLTQEMIDDGIKIPTPIRIWNWGMKNMTGNLRSVSKELMIVSLMRRGKALVTGRGIKFQNGYYTCNIAELERWYSRSRIERSWYVDIAYDNRDMSQIYIVDKRDNKIFECKIIQENSYNELLKNKTYEEMESYLYMDSINRSINKDIENQNQLELYDNIKDIVNEAKDLSLEKVNLKTNVRDNKREENSNYREGQSLTNKKDTSSVKDTNGYLDIDLNSGIDIKDKQTDINSYSKRKENLKKWYEELEKVDG